VGLSVAVRLPPALGEPVGVVLGLSVGETVPVRVGVPELVGVPVIVAVPVAVPVPVGMLVGVSVFDGVLVSLGVKVTVTGLRFVVGVEVALAETVGVSVVVAVAVAVGVSVWKPNGVGVAVTGPWVGEPGNLDGPPTRRAWAVVPIRSQTSRITRAQRMIARIPVTVPRRLGTPMRTPRLRIAIYIPIMAL